jgi:flagellar biosynthesis protein FlhA
VTPALAKNPLNGISLQTISQRTDIIFALGLITVLVLLIMPVPALLLDLLLAGSITFSVLILLTSLFIEKPLEFSSFPTVLLVSTMVRMALDVASTRLILSHGHEGPQSAGRVIQAFGNLIMGGNFVIGLIVFSILVIINFVVITKGSGRIAEVSARFSLDAMPGKQMAVDADLSAGLIDEAEARKRRKLLEEESNFFGAMDGAAKFVRGDAIASLLITFINIVGGIIIGVAQMGLSFMDALHSYTVLTVGDGLVSQVPALIVSTGAGMLVSKAGAEGTAEQALFRQMSAYPTALGLSSFLTGTIALLPGIPFLPFLFLAAGTGFAAWRITQSQEKAKDEEKQEKLIQATTKEQAIEESPATAASIDHLRIEIGFGLLSLLNTDQGKKLTDQIKNLRKQMVQEIGFVLPSVRIQDNVQLSGNTYVIRVKELEAGRGELKPDMLLVMDPRGTDIDLEGETTVEPTFGLAAKWIVPPLRDRAERQGYTVVDASTVLTTHLTEVVKDYLSDLLTYADTQKMLNDLPESYKKLLNDLVPSQITIGGIQRVLQNLVQERVSIRDLPLILEAISEACGFSRNIGLITEHVRQRLNRQISFSHADDKNVLHIISLSPQWEQHMHGALVGDGDVKQLALAPSQVQDFMTDFQKLFDRLTMSGEAPVLVTSTPLRPYVRSIVERVRPSAIVMAQSEVHPKIKLKSLGQV